MGGAVTLTAWEQFAWIASGAAVVMLCLWGVQTRTRNATSVDAAWALCIGAAAVFAAITSSGDVWTRSLLAGLAAMWGVRLSMHILLRMRAHAGEDGRYAALRRKFEPREQPVFLFVYGVQGLLVVALTSPFVLGSRDVASGLGVLDIAGGSLWLTGWMIESVADWQLRLFKRDPASRGGVCDVGLWRYSRHPNFFGEWLMWCAYALIATASPFGLLAWTAPLLMLVMILKVSGIPPTEAQSIRNRGEAYRAYQTRTSAFVPWPPRAVSRANGASTP